MEWIKYKYLAKKVKPAGKREGEVPLTIVLLSLPKELGYLTDRKEREKNHVNTKHRTTEERQPDRR